MVEDLVEILHLLAGVGEEGLLLGEEGVVELPGEREDNEESQERQYQGYPLHEWLYIYYIIA